jgi:hypothetical protein
MGLSTYFNLTKFSGGTLQKIVSPLPWVLVVRWACGDQPGVVFVNVYAAIHTEGTLGTDVVEFGDFITDLRSSMGGDEFIIAGDLNIDMYRRPAPIHPLEKIMIRVVKEIIDDDFAFCPTRPSVTYADSLTTLDYCVYSSGVLLLS